MEILKVQGVQLKIVRCLSKCTVLYYIIPENSNDTWFVW